MYHWYSSPMQGILLSFIISSFLYHDSLLCAATTTCYDPDGSVAEGNYPCNPDADESVCCGAGGPGSVCLNNKVCLNNGVETIRGTCTDSTWNSPECPGWCQQASTGGTDLISCSNVTGSTADYCCDHTDNCCDSGVGRFQILPSIIATSATWVSSLTAYETVPTTNTATLSVNTTSSFSLASTTSATSSWGATVSFTDTATPIPSTGLSTGAEAGIGVGAGLAGLILIAALVSFLVLRRRKQSRIQERVDDSARYQDHRYPTELQGGELDSRHIPPEMEEQNRFELAQGRNDKEAVLRSRAVHEMG